jgi:D-alanine transaminase
MLVYLNGAFVPYERALVPVEDRGYVFADGIYEVIPFYHGKPLGLKQHLARLARSAEAIRLPLPPLVELEAAALETVARNGGGDVSLYMQVTRGTAPRKHAFPAEIQPTVYMLARPLTRPAAELLQNGVKCITVPDIRWQLCYIKSIGLLPNTLAKQHAVEAGAHEAVFVRDGVITEGSSSNFFLVIGDTVLTHPADQHILAGITRTLVLEAAAALGIPVREERCPEVAVKQATEAFLTSSTSEVLPVTVINGEAVGDGRPGPVTRRLWEAYDRAVRTL